MTKLLDKLEKTNQFNTYLEQFLDEKNAKEIQSFIKDKIWFSIILIKVFQKALEEEREKANFMEGLGVGVGVACPLFLTSLKKIYIL